MANVQDLDVYADENRTLTLYARNSSNAVVDLTSKTVTWRVGRPPQRPDVTGQLIEKTGTVTSAANGIFTVAITPSDTDGLYGEYAHQAFTTDGSGNVAVVVTGRFNIRRFIGA